MPVTIQWQQCGTVRMGEDVHSAPGRPILQLAPLIIEQAGDYGVQNLRGEISQTNRRKSALTQNKIWHPGSYIRSSSFQI